MSDTKFLILARHGQSISNSVSSEQLVPNEEKNKLTPIGEAQAVSLANSLRTLPRSVVFSSPSLRARETAQIVCAALGASCNFEDSLVERHFNFSEGVTNDRSRILQALAHQCPSTRIEGAESVNEFHERVSKWFDDFLRKFESQISINSAILVSHGGPIEVIMMRMLNLGAENIGKTALRCDTGHMHVWRRRSFSEELNIWSLEAANVNSLGPYIG